MSTKAIKRKRDTEGVHRDWKPLDERAPSIIRKDQPTTARVIAMIAAMLVIVGLSAAGLRRGGSQSLLAQVIGYGWGIFLIMFGSAGLLFHAANEQELRYRRSYGLLGAVLVGLGVIWRLWPARIGQESVIGGYFLSMGAPALALGLCFLGAFVRHETDEKLKLLTTRLIGVAAALLILVGFIGGVMYEEFLMGQGIVHLILGLIYAAAYVAIKSPTSRAGYRAGFAIGVVGVLMIVIALGKALPYGDVPVLGLLKNLFFFVKWLSGQPGAAFLFTYIGLEFLLLSFGVCSDSQLVAMTRRELGAYFYSPIVYIVLVALAFMGGMSFVIWVNWLIRLSAGGAMMMQGGGGALEPIVGFYFFSLVPVICVILLVPAITMRLLSEENRSGTLEVMLTTPVKESTVVIAKFLAALRIFMLAWYPWLLYLVALWIEGGREFDYRPVLSFFVGLLVTGAGFVGMGLFFSSLTRNQIVAAILTFMGMIALLSFYLLQSFSQQIGDFWTNLLTYMSFLDVWLQTSHGLVAPRYMFFHVSAAIFWLFLTVKVLESRKWR